MKTKIDIRLLYEILGGAMAIWENEVLQSF